MRPRLGWGTTGTLETDEQRPRWALPFLAALAPLILLAWRFDFLVDDAFITFRYAENLAAGNGLVFNPGEEGPVEGYSNLLWTLAMAAAQAVGLDPALASRWLSVSSAVALLALVSRLISQRVAVSQGEAALSSVFFASLPPISVWASGGLETMPFALAVFATFERLAGERGRARPIQAGLAGAAGVLLRADGFVWVGLALGAALVARRLDGRPELARKVLVAALLAGATAAAQFLWRRGFYGAWTPNTARAKVDLGPLALEQGGKYVLSMLLAIPSIPIALGHAAGYVRGSGRSISAAALVFVTGGFGYTAVVGGDWMMMYRLLVPTMPFVAIAFGVVVAALHGSSRTALFVASLALSLLPSFDRHPIPLALRRVAHFRWGDADVRSEYEVWRRGVVDIKEWILLGRALALHTEPGESVVLGNVGAIPYYSGLIAYDTHGLTNREPFAEVDPDTRAWPGHYRKVTMSTFDRLRPTYRGVGLAHAEDPRAGLPKRWLDPANTQFELEIVPLEAERGFPEGTVLQLVRQRW